MIKVLKSGLHTSIQDAGRFGYRHLGVPVSGFMDSSSAQLANSILGNDKNTPVLEITMVGGALQFLESARFVVSGADMSANLNKSPIVNNKVHLANKNDILAFGKLKSGLRSYLSVKGGFKSDLVLGSQSLYKPLTVNDKLFVGDTVLYDKLQNKLDAFQQFSKLKIIDFTSEELLVYKGPEFDLLNKDHRELLLSTRFQVSNLYNRMAYQLTPNVLNDMNSILTSAVLPGTVQLTPSGKLVVLMRDCQTTGGYPRILQLTGSAINLLAQKKERDHISFKIKD